MTVPASGTARSWRGWALTGAALLAVLAWDASGADLALSRTYGGPTGFAWRDAWLTRTVLHDGGRWLAGGVLLLLAWDLVRPLWAGPGRAEKGYWLAVVVLSMLGVPAFKRLSQTSCPWDLAEFGGTATYVSHWLPGLADGGGGHCFPSGHAVTAFAFTGLAFLWWPHRPRVAWVVAAATALVGALFAWAQLARGAHFVSHSLWSAWLCLALACVARRWAPAAARLSGGAPSRGHRPAGDPFAGAQPVITRIE